jgi:hypothetical protein
MKRMKYGQDLFRYLLVYSGCFLLCLLTITFSQTSAQAQSDPPYVVSTIPKNYATDVSTTADLVSITFNKDMDTSYRSVATSNWYSTRDWSDNRTLTLKLQDHPDFENYPHRPNTKVWITINSPSIDQVFTFVILKGIWLKNTP